MQATVRRRMHGFVRPRRSHVAARAAEDPHAELSVSLIHSSCRLGVARRVVNLARNNSRCNIGLAEPTTSARMWSTTGFESERGTERMEDMQPDVGATSVRMRVEEWTARATCRGVEGGGDDTRMTKVKGNARA